jgi:MOSC domain-containing protein YiiM
MLQSHEEWVRELDRDHLSFRQFGENLTLEGATEDKVHIGDVFRSVVLSSR